MYGTRAPTAKNLVATAIAMRPLSRSRKTIDQVIGPRHSSGAHPHEAPLEWRGPMRSSPGRVALHAARVGGGLAPRILAARGGQAALGPVVVHLDFVAALAQFLDRLLGHPALQHQHARTGGARPEGGGEVLAMPGRRVDRLLQVHAAMDMAEEHLRDPLLLLVAARRAPAHVRLAGAMGEGRRERRARPLARRQRRRLAFLEPADLAACAHREAELRNDRRAV